ncbi:MAG: hypothetical protein IJO46_04845, partial [Thermoguttaceae bacterium]|nr:hypothetical protein [Thermoguttaceae bacterium]
GFHRSRWSLPGTLNFVDGSVFRAVGQIGRRSQAALCPLRSVASRTRSLPGRFNFGDGGVWKGRRLSN